MCKSNTVNLVSSLPSRTTPCSWAEVDLRHSTIEGLLAVFLDVEGIPVFHLVQIDCETFVNLVDQTHQTFDEVNVAKQSKSVLVCSTST